jgi:RNA polymerase sigma-70 factor (ECF subfamily)
MGTAPPVGAELKQHLRVKLLVGEGGAAPKLAQYSGAGSLSAWVRVVTMREVQMARRKVQREVPADDLAAAAIDGADLEIGYLKQRYGAEFREALAHALQNLSARERNLLRLHYLHGKGIDQIAAIYHVGRSTAARWLIKIRADLFSQVQSHLMQRLRITPTEFDSLARLVRSQLEISITGLLDSHAAGRTAEEK